MAHATHHRAHPAARALLVSLLAVLPAACSADPGGTDGSGATPTSTVESSDGGGTFSTTKSDDSEPADEAATLPGSMWGVEAESYDLVRIDTGSGEIVQRIAGWGAGAGSGEQEGGLQALQEIAAKGENLWVADCCEPAVGTVYRVDPEDPSPVPDAAIRVNGTSPLLSPDGTRLAVSVLDIGVAVHDATTGELLVGPELIGVVTSPPAGVEAPYFAKPVSWLDDDTLAVAVDSDAASTVMMVSITQPSAPSTVGPVIEVDGTILDGATRSDGALVVAVESTGGNAVAGRVYSTDTGAEEAAFNLDPATTAIDYDASGSFLLVSRESLPPTWQGLGEVGELGATPLVFAAWDEPDGGAGRPG